MDKVIAGQADLTYEFLVEMMPEFALADVSGFKLEKPVYQPTDEDVADTLGELAGQAKGYETKSGKAADGDQVVIDFVGKIGDEAFEGGTANDVPLVLGSGQFIPGFEDQLVGAKAGDEKVLKVTFPADYQAEQLKGKDAQFEVKVKEVKSPVDRAVDDELAKGFGIESLEKLKEMIRGNLAEQYEQTSRFKLKRALLDALDAEHSFDLPPRMVEAEFQAIWQQVLADEAREGRSEEDKNKSEEELQSEYRKIAERRVRLGLVLAEIGRERGVTVSDQEVGQAMQNEAMNMARQYNMPPQQVYDMLRQNPNFVNQIRAPLFEQKVVDLLFGVAQVTDKPVSKDELMKEDDLPEGYGADGDKPAKKAAKPKAEKKAKDEGADGDKPAKEAKPKAAKAKKPE
jgi:trigger factor